jgi:hypothetical protein
VSDFTPEQLSLFAALDERPSVRVGGSIFTFCEAAEYRARDKGRRNGRSTREVALQLEELARRAREQDGQLRELGII